MKLNVFEDSPSKTAFFSAENGAENQNPPLYESKKVIIRGGLPSTYCRRVDFARRQGRKNEPRMQENVVFCVFLRLHCYRDLEQKNGRFEASSPCGFRAADWAGNERERDRVRERERERERYRISKNASASAAVW